jgi:hypothetical protein
VFGKHKDSVVYISNPMEEKQKLGIKKLMRMKNRGWEQKRFKW